MSLSLLIILFSLAGIPPMAGFFAKFYVFMAVVESGMFTLAAIGLVTTVVSAFYYIRIIKIMYFDDPKKPFEQLKDFGIYGSLIVSCIFLISFFLYPSILNEIISNISIF
jgi:NADH-quinone oxidoreductase subunit N